ncbi:ribosomal protein L7/L12 [Paractinoplanes lichenicola]|uniref:Ribosomal protein L7/L12 n=1 Tax=Paractinoplanes lichenicola TaxID=2802976 RepID=A0ABS1W4A3_9ACTN|nr:ribosomal protein L7/L12 [Actinoplanes lichenicola]MBL7261554.1 ribosomal protein L7/L12 [Actinoplanes lichenicola]
MDFAYVVAIIIALVGFGLVVASNRAQRNSHETARLAAIERKLDTIMNHLGIEEPATTEDPEVLAHLMRGEKIQAIKVYRERTGAGLAEAKNAVERMARERGLS